VSPNCGVRSGPEVPLTGVLPSRRKNPTSAPYKHPILYSTKGNLVPSRSAMAATPIYGIAGDSCERTRGVWTEAEIGYSCVAYPAATGTRLSRRFDTILYCMV